MGRNFPKVRDLLISERMAYEMSEMAYVRRMSRSALSREYVQRVIDQNEGQKLC